jgi:hypothetical protein
MFSTVTGINTKVAWQILYLFLSVKDKRSLPVREAENVTKHRAHCQLMWRPAASIHEYLAKCNGINYGFYAMRYQ